MKKGLNALYQCRNSINKSWSLPPRKIPWIYPAIFRQVITCGCVVWWSASDKNFQQKILDQFHRIISLSIAGVKEDLSSCCSWYYSLPDYSWFGSYVWGNRDAGNSAQYNTWNFEYCLPWHFRFGVLYDLRWKSGCPKGQYIDLMQITACTWVQRVVKYLWSRSNSSVLGTETERYTQ